jgi:hypothetical protein
MGWEFDSNVYLVVVDIGKEYDDINVQEIRGVVHRADVHNC